MFCNVPSWRDIHSRREPVSAIVNVKPLHSHPQQIIHALSQQAPLSFCQLVDQLKLTEGEVFRAILFLKKNDPALLNELGTSRQYRLSIDGMKLLHVDPPSPKKFRPPDTFHFAPGPRGKLIEALKHTHSIPEVARRSGLNVPRTRYFLKCLADQGLVNMKRSDRDRRALDLRLTTEEPPQPVLTPAIVPLSDPLDWRTWCERLLLAQQGGPAVVIEEEHQQEENQPLIKTNIVRKRILIAGTWPEWEHLLEKEFGKKIRLAFHNDFNGASTELRALLKSTDLAIVSKRRTRHATDWVIKASGVPYLIIDGALTNLRKTLENYLGQAIVQKRA